MGMWFFLHLTPLSEMSNIFLFNYIWMTGREGRYNKQIHPVTYNTWGKTFPVIWSPIPLPSASEATFQTFRTETAVFCYSNKLLSLNICFFPPCNFSSEFGNLWFQNGLSCCFTEAAKHDYQFGSAWLSHCPPFKLWDKDQPLIPTVILQWAHS